MMITHAMCNWTGFPFPDSNVISLGFEVESVKQEFQKEQDSITGRDSQDSSAGGQGQEGLSQKEAVDTICIMSSCLE